jgi:CBS domain-containing protein
VIDILTAEDAGHRTVGDATDRAPTVGAGQTLGDVVDLLDRADAAVVPVTDDSTGRLVGWLTAAGVLNAIRSTNPR